MSDVLFPVTTIAERAYAGALMHLTVDEASKAAEMVCALDLQDELVTLIHAVVLDLTAHKVTPDPVAVLGAIRNSGVYPEANRLQLAARAIAKLYEETPHPFCYPQYAKQLLEDAFRRRVADYGARLSQIADVSAISDIDCEVREGIELLRQLRRRVSAAGGDAQ